MSATTTPTLLNLAPLPRPRTVNELANTINYTYSEINRAFTIISRAFKFDKTVTTGNTTVTGTQIGGFLITADSLVSTNTTDNLQIGLYSSNAVTGYFSLITGDIAASGTKVVTSGNGITYGFYVQVNSVVVAQMRRGLFNNHGYLSVTKSDNTTVFVADGNANACTVGGTLTMSGLGATDGLYARTSSNTKLYIGSGTDTVVRLGGTTNHRAELAILTGNYGVISRDASSLVITSLTHNSGTSVGALYVGDATGVNYVTASGLGDVTMTRNLSVSGVTTLSSTQSSSLTVTSTITTLLLQFSAGGSLYFPGAFIGVAPVATGYLVARDNGGFYYKLLAAPYP